MGDMLSFIEKAQQTYDEKQAKKLEEKLKKNSFTLSDYLRPAPADPEHGRPQPAGGHDARQSSAISSRAHSIDEKAMAHTEAIILSMTPEERENPQILGASRKKRIAAGCGLEVVDVNRLLKAVRGNAADASSSSPARKPGFGLGCLGTAAACASASRINRILDVVTQSIYYIKHQSFITFWRYSING